MSALCVGGGLLLAWTVLADPCASRLVSRQDFRVPPGWIPQTVMGREFWPLFLPSYWTCDAPEWKKRGEILKQNWPPLELYRDCALLHSSNYNLIKDVMRDRGKNGEYLKRGPHDYETPIKVGDFFKEPNRTTLYSNPKPDAPVMLEIQNARPIFRHKDKYDLDMADFAAWKASHPNFVGFRALVELDSDITGYEYGLKQIKDESLRNELIATFGTCDSPEARYAALCAAFKRSVALRYGEERLWTMYSSALSMGHQMANCGATGLFYEATSQECGRWQVAGAFLRGAARQFGIPYGWYVATWCTSWSRDGKEYCGANSLKSMQNAKHQPFMGAGRNSADRQSAYGYLIGSTFMEVEGPIRTHLAQADDSAPVVPSDYAKDMDELNRLSRRFKRGGVYAPCALLTPLVMRYTSSGDPRFHGGHPYAYNAFFFTLCPIHSADFAQRALMKKGLQSRLHNSPFGEFYDVLVPDSDEPSEKFGSALGAYKAAFLIGEYEKEKLDVKALKKFVLDGGTLFVSADKVLDGFLQSDFTGVAFGSDAKMSSGLDEIYALHVPVGECLAKPVITDAVGNVAVWCREYGTGNVVTVAAKHYLPREYLDDVRKGVLERTNGIASGARQFSVIRRLLTRVQDETMPCRVEGDCQWGLNKTPEGWALWLFNNKGVTKYTFEPESFDMAATAKVEIDLSRLQVSSVRDVRRGTDLEIRDEHLTVEVGPGEWRIFDIQ